MEKSVLPKNQIFIFNDVFSSDFCEILVNFIKNVECTLEKDSDPNTNVNGYVTHLGRTKDPTTKKYLHNKIHDTLEKISLKLIKNGNHCKSNGYSEVQLRKIFGKTRYHVDGVVSMNSCDDYINTNLLRKMSVIIALNDDYEGGEICFPEQDFKIKLKKGQAIAFPPYWTHPHYTTELLNNTVRYTANTWFYE
jgi:predicted 2-oxoglutarate/Fe(II)-dependent dioxygenase YbiX